MQRNRGTGDKRRAERILPPLAVLTVATVLVVLTIVLGPVRVTTPDWLGDDDLEPLPEISTFLVPEQTATPVLTTDDAEPVDIDLPLREIGLVVLTAIATVLVYVTYRLLKNVRIPRRGKAGEIIGGELDDLQSAEELRRAAEAGAATLGSAALPPANAIIAAWVGLEEAAADVGDRRRPAQTPSEFTADLLRRHNADAASVDRLLHLYHEARFSTRPDLSPDDVQAAQTALSAITQTLAQPAESGPDSATYPNGAAP